MKRFAAAGAALLAAWAVVAGCTGPRDAHRQELQTTVSTCDGAGDLAARSACWARAYAASERGGP